MAAYAATVAFDTRASVRIPGTRLSVLYGTINITNYNTTPTEITAITSRFRGTPRVMLGGFTDSFHAVFWDNTLKSVKAAFPTQQTASAGNRAGVEATTDTDVGLVEFMAIGIGR